MKGKKNNRKVDVCVLIKAFQGTSFLLTSLNLMKSEVRSVGDSFTDGFSYK